MNDGALHRDKVAHHAGMLVSAVLHAIDAGVRGLQSLRQRFEVPVEDEESPRERSGRGRPVAADQPPAPVATASPSQSPWHRALVVLMCLLLGGVAGMLVSYRGFAKLLDTREAVIETLQDEVERSKKEEALNLNAKAKYQKELIDYRKQLRETQQELEDYRGRLEELSGRLAALQRVERPAAPSGRGVVPTAAAKAGMPQKTGTCVTGTANLTGRLADCIDQFNRP